MVILGIETSCDETAASVVRGERGRITILSHTVSSQIKTHRRYGGVVPEVAARRHVINMVPTIDLALHDAHVKPADLDLLAVTAGPGLITSLRVGVQTAKTLSFAWGTKLIGVNHMEGHIYANWAANQPIAFPIVCLVVSGGHTQLILMTGHGKYKLIGQTRDDAAGEAFDKVAKLLRLPYPGGPNVQRAAAKGDPRRFDFPRPMLNAPGYEFSFSGLKTSVLYLAQKIRARPLPIADLCASFQQAVVEVLVQKTVRAAKQFKAKHVILAGGVAANTPLRTTLERAVTELTPHVGFHVPPLKLCTDNASMIAIAGYFRALKKRFSRWQRLDADPNWELV